MPAASAILDHAHVNAVFDSLDADKSGALEYKELNEMLRKGAVAFDVEAKNRIELRRCTALGQSFRGKSTCQSG